MMGTTNAHTTGPSKRQGVVWDDEDYYCSCRALPPYGHQQGRNLALERTLLLPNKVCY